MNKFSIQNLERTTEGRTLEFKREVPQKLDGILHTIIAFSNGSGEELIIGIDNSNNIVGIDDDPLELEERLSSTIYDNIIPIPSVFFQTIYIKEKILLKIKILSGSGKPYFLKHKGPEKGAYIRIGSTNRVVDTFISSDLRRQAYNKSYDEEIDTNFNCDIFSLELLKQYLKWRNIQISPDLVYFVKEKLAISYNRTCHPTIGGLLLFSKTLPSQYQYAGFNIAVYNGDNRSELKHSHLILSGLYKLPEDVIETLGLYLKNTTDIKGLRREQDLEIPFLALREAIVNAICHRDYVIQGASNKIDIFTDRVEIISPGTLPIGINIEDLGLGTSEIRNKLIVKIFRKAGYIEQLGTGIIRMRQVCRDNGLPDPGFSEVGNFFKVVFYRQLSGLIPRLKIIYDLIKVKGGLSSSQIAGYLKIHQNTVIKRVKELQEKNMVEKIGKGPDTIYKISM